jgi:hypothetical protein
MTIETLRDRIQKANEKIEKKLNTIAKKEALIEKKMAKISNLGFAYEEIKGGVCNNDKNHDDAIDMAYDIDWLKDDIRRLTKEVEATRETLEKYEKQLAGEVEKESIFVKEIPESMKAMQDELVVKWDEWDISKRDLIRKDRETMNYKELCRKYNAYELTQLRYKSDEEIHEANMKDAKYFIIDLYNRVKAITGEVTDWSGVHAVGTALNGFIIGKEGRAEVESILAGGYNIQRLHVRVLVHAR